VEVGGLHYDIGAFIYEREHPLFDLFPFLRDLCARVPARQRSVTPVGSLDRYPLTLRGYARDHGRAHAAAALAHLVWCKWACRRRASLPEHLEYYLGRTLYVESGLKTYIERLFGLPDAEVGLEFARYRLTKVETACSWRAAARRMLRGRRAVAAVYADEGYVRPKAGFAAVYGPVAEALRRSGVRVRTSARVQEARREAGEHALCVDGVVERYDDVVSTIPIPTLARLAGMELQARLETRSLFSLFYRHSGALRHDATYLYNFHPEGRWKRMTTFSEMHGRHEGDAWFTVEGTLDAGCGEEALEACRRDFETTAAARGLFDGTPAYQGGLITASAYPVYRPRDKPALEGARQALRDRGFVPVGRQGAFDYLGSGTIAANARRTARELVAQRGRPADGPSA
jgi:hypothetical protein